MENINNFYGLLKDGTALTDESASELVDNAFKSLHEGKGRIIKQPSQKHIRVSVKDLPTELQQAVLYL